MKKWVKSWKWNLKLKLKTKQKKERARFLGILVGTLPSKHLSWWWRTEDVLKTSWRSLQCNIFLSSKTSSRRLQDIVVRRLLEDVLKTSWRRGLANASLRGLLKTSWRHLEDALKTFLEDVLQILLEDVFKTSWKMKNYYAENDLENEKYLLDRCYIIMESITR